MPPNRNDAAGLPFIFPLPLRVVGWFLSLVLTVIGLGGIKDELKQWQAWLAMLDGDAVRTLCLLLAIGVYAATDQRFWRWVRTRHEVPALDLRELVSQPLPPQSASAPMILPQAPVVPYHPTLILSLRNENENDWEKSNLGLNYLDVRNNGARSVLVRFVIKDARDLHWDRPRDSVYDGSLLRHGRVAFLPWESTNNTTLAIPPGPPRAVKLASLDFVDPEQTHLRWEVPYVLEDGQPGTIQFWHFPSDGKNGGGGTLFLSVDVNAGFGGVSHDLKISFAGESIEGVPSELK